MSHGYDHGASHAPDHAPRHAEWFARVEQINIMPSRPKLFRPHGAPSRQRLEAETEARRGSARERGYGTAWDKFAAAFKVRHPLCLGCEAVGLTRATRAVDHVEPHDGDPAKFWCSEDGYQPACGWHHDRMKQRLEAQWRAGSIPLSALRLDSPQAVALTRELMEQGERP